MKPDPTIIVACDDDVYEPSDDTYLLLNSLNIKQRQKVLDIGTGTGIIAIHAAKNGASCVVGTDISAAAVACARRNAVLNNLEVAFVICDLFSGIKEQFDTIVFNPPYLPEGCDGCDDVRWTGGAVGVELTKRFILSAREHLLPGGKIYTIVSSLATPESHRRNETGFQFLFDDIGYSYRIAGMVSFPFERIYALELAPQ